MKAVLRGLLIALAAALVGYLAWDRVEVYRINRDVKAIAARGEPVDLSSLEREPSTPQAQEAARLYAEAGERASEVARSDARLTRVDVDAVVGRVPVKDIEDAFRIDGPAMQLLDRATPLPFSGFGGTMEPQDALSGTGLQSLGMLSALRADLFAYHGNGDAAANALTAAVRVQRTLATLFARNLVAQRQFGSLRVLLRHSAPSPAALAALQEAFAEMPDDDLIVHELTLRRAFFIEMQADAVAPRGLSPPIAIALHPFLLRRVRLQLEQYPEVIAASRTPWPDKIAAINALDDSAGPRDSRGPIARIVSGPAPNLAAITAAPSTAALRLTVRRLALTTLAIERYRRAHHGTAPPDLASLVPAFMPAVPVDPFSGASPVYKASPTDYLLYGLDVNRKDDGGQIYGLGSLNPMPYPRMRDFGIRVPLTPQRGAQ